MYLQDFTDGDFPNPLLANPPPRVKTPPPPPSPVIEPEPKPVAPKDLGPYKADVSRKDHPKRNVGEAARAARAAKMAAGARRMQPSMSSLHLASFPVPGQDVIEPSFRPASIRSEAVSEITPVNAWVNSRAAAQLTNFKEKSKATKDFDEYAQEADLDVEKTAKLVGSLGEGVGFTFKATCNFVHPNRQLPRTGKKAREKKSKRNSSGSGGSDEYGADRMNSLTSDGGWQQGWSVNSGSRNNSDAGVDPSRNDLAPDEDSDSADEDIAAILAAQAVKPVKRHSLFPPANIIVNAVVSAPAPQPEYVDEDEYVDEAEDEVDVAPSRHFPQPFHGGELGSLAEEEEEEEVTTLRPGRILSHIFGRPPVEELDVLREESDEEDQPALQTSVHALEAMAEEEEEDDDSATVSDADEATRQSLAYVLPDLNDNLTALFEEVEGQLADIITPDRSPSLRQAEFATTRISPLLVQGSIATPTRSPAMLATDFETPRPTTATKDTPQAALPIAEPSHTLSRILSLHGTLGTLFTEPSPRASLEVTRPSSPIHTRSRAGSLHSIKSSLSLRHRRSDSEPPALQQRTSFDRAVSLLARGFDTPDEAPLSRAAKIASARRAFDEREAAKERKWEERQRRRSAVTERSMSWTQRRGSGVAVDSPVDVASSRDSFSTKRSLSISGRSAFDVEDRSASVTRATTVVDEEEGAAEALFPAYEEGAFAEAFDKSGLLPPVKGAAVVVQQQGLFPPVQASENYYFLNGTWYNEFGDEVSGEVVEELERDRPRRPLSMTKQAKGKMSKLSAWGRTRIMRA